RADVDEAGVAHPLANARRCRIPSSIDADGRLEVFVDVPTVEAGVRIQTDGHHPAARDEDAARLCDKRDLVVEVMKRVDAEEAGEASTGPRQRLRPALREDGPARLRPRVLEHVLRRVYARGSNAALAKEPQPAAGAAPDLQHAAVRIPADECGERGFH